MPPKSKLPKSKATSKEKSATRKVDFSLEIVEGIRSKFGDDSAMLLGSDGLSIALRGVISTQIPTVDAAIGRGGIPRGRLTILHGPEGCGKTTLALMIVAMVQKMGGAAAYIDKEYKLDPDYAATLGVDVDHLALLQPEYLEKMFEQSKMIIGMAAKMEKGGNRIPVVIVLDSMNAAITKAQYEGEWTDKHYAPQARVYSELLPKLMPFVSTGDVALVWISQVRKKMNVMFGDDSEIAGGNAPKFYASLILDIKRIGSDKKDGERINNRTRVTCKKNQIAPPFKKGEFDIVYGKGVDSIGALLDQAEKQKIVEKSGAWYSYEGERLGQGKEGASKLLEKNPALADEIHGKIYKKWNS